MSDVTLVQTFNFSVTLTSTNGDGSFTTGAFQEVTGLEAEMDVKEYLEGGRNDGVIQRIGRAKYPQKLVLKRGMFLSGGELSLDLWQWFQDTVAGVRPIRRYDGSVEVHSPSGDTQVTWRFRRGLPARVTGPQLNAKTGEIAIEELHIAHEGLFLEGTA